MLPGKRYTPADFVTILRKRWLYIVIPTFAGLFLALLVSRFWPNTYVSETLIQIIPQRVPDSYVRSTVTTDLDERLKSITQQIRSRSRLEGIITDLKLYPAQRERGAMSDAVERMNEAVEIQVAAPGRSRGRITEPDSFTLRFSYGDPQTAKRVTEELSNWFIAENKRIRGMQAESTNEFLEAQLADARVRLVAQEKKLEAFRQRHAGRLPSEVQTNLQGIQATQMQLQALMSSLEADRGRKAITERLYNDAVADLKVFTSAPLPVPPPSGGDQTMVTGTARQQLETARQQLTQLEMRLTAEHPDIIRAKRRVADLEKKAEAEERQASSGPSTAPPRPVTAEETTRRERISGLRAELDGLNRTIASKEGEMRRLQAMVGDYQSRVAAVPGLESEWISLSRDYDTLQENYRGLLQKSEESKVAANLEKQQIGEQFRILDPPSAPSRPSSPQRILINIAGLILGLLLGVALVGLIEFLDSTYHSDADVVNALSLPVIAVVPQLATDASIRQAARRKWLMGVAAVATVVGCLGVAVTLQLWRYVI
jgi:polysaccharide chain length determinant protein (PEP-CTERM system associated)